MVLSIFALLKRYLVSYILEKFSLKLSFFSPSQYVISALFSFVRMIDISEMH